MELARTAPRRRPPTRGDRREQAILDGARALLAERPLSQVSTDELAAAAGLSRSSLYFYFESKQAVLAALLDRLTDELVEENAAWLDSDGPAEPALRRAAEHSVALWRGSGFLLRQAWHCDASDSQLVAWREQVVERAVRRTVAKIERDRASGRAPATPLSAPVLARALHAVKADLLAAERSPEDDPLAVDDLVALTLRLLYAAVS